MHTDYTCVRVSNRITALTLFRISRVQNYGEEKGTGKYGFIERWIKIFKNFLCQDFGQHDDENTPVKFLY